jgi:hypothetical protein
VKNNDVTGRNRNTESKLANSPINILNLNAELMEYVQVNNAHDNELRTGFSNGFRLGYMGPRVQQKSDFSSTE